MYNKFIRQNPTDIINYLKYMGDMKPDFRYLKYKIHEGTLSHIAIMEFYTFNLNGESIPIIIDMSVYFNYYRQLKLKHLKSKMI